MPKPLIAIVGRPNVGKSALFNRLVRKRIAIVEDLAGTTRDRLYADFDIWSRTCTLIDTGGFDPLEKEGYTPAILGQTQFAIEEADLIIFLLDGHEEPTTLDFEIAGVLRRTRKPVIVAANKLDSLSVARRAPDFYELRLGEAMPVSAASGYGVAELTEKIEELLPPEEADEEEEDDGSTKIALVGRPNVGKSAMTNHVLGYERTIVSPVPGTTRDAVDTKLEWKDEAVTLIDTAGMRRKSKVKQDKTSVEYHMVLRSLRAVDRCDVAVVVLDSGGVAEQDTKIAGYAHEAGKAVVVVVNKWDVMESEIASTPEALNRQTPAQADYAGMIARYLPFVSYAPIHFTSAITGYGVETMLDDALSIAPNVHLRIPTSQLNDVVRRAIAEHPTPSVKGQQIKIRYATQAETAPPKIIIFCNHPELVHFSYIRYLENTIRAQFPFRGVPLKLELRKSGSGDDEDEARPVRRNRPARAAIAEKEQDKAAREEYSDKRPSRAKSLRQQAEEKAARAKPVKEKVVKDKAAKDKTLKEKAPRENKPREKAVGKTAGKTAAKKPGAKKPMRARKK